MIKSIALTIAVLYLASSPPVVVSQEGEEPPAHVTDPAQCTTYCYPPGYDGDRPKEINPEAVGKECGGSMCAKAEHGADNCQPHMSCTVHCSEVCCVCLRECI